MSPLLHEYWLSESNWEILYPSPDVAKIRLYLGPSRLIYGIACPHSEAILASLSSWPHLLQVSSLKGNDDTMHK